MCVRLALVVRGSMDMDYFLELFEVVLRDFKAGGRVYDARAAPYRNDEWWSARSGKIARSHKPSGGGSETGGVCTPGGGCEDGDTCGA